VSRPTKLDRDKLHRWLYSQADPRTHRLQVVNTRLADLLGMRADHLGRIIKEMVGQGRLLKVSTERYRVASYFVVDPDVWAASPNAPPPTPTRQVLKWQ
jgi:hypothetical protein